MAVSVRKGDWTGPACGYCGQPTKRKFEIGKGKDARRQHGRLWVCKRRHQIVRKVSQAG